MVAKQPTQKHFTKRFGGGTVSDRVILPKRDKCRVKLTKFRPRTGFTLRNVADQVDEVVYVVRGQIKVTQGRKAAIFGPGASYLVPAGQKRTITVLKTGLFICFFSRAGHGPVPDDG